MNNSLKYVSSLMNPHEMSLDEMTDNQLSQRSRLSFSLRRNDKHTGVARWRPSLDIVSTTSKTNANCPERCKNCWAPRSIFCSEILFDSHKTNCTFSYQPTKLCNEASACTSNNVFHYKKYFHIHVRRSENEKENSRDMMKVKPNYFRYYPKRLLQNLSSVHSNFSDNFDSDFEDERPFDKKSPLPSNKKYLIKSHVIVNTDKNFVIDRQPIVLLHRLSENEIVAWKNAIPRHITAVYNSKAPISPVKNCHTIHSKGKFVTTPKNNNVITKYFKPIIKCLIKDNGDDCLNVSVDHSIRSNDGVKVEINQATLKSLRKTLPSPKSSHEEDDSALLPITKHTEISVSETCLDSEEETNFDELFRDDQIDYVNSLVSQKRRKIYDSVADIKESKKVRRLMSSDLESSTAPFDCSSIASLPNIGFESVNSAVVPVQLQRVSGIETTASPELTKSSSTESSVVNYFNTESISLSQMTLDLNDCDKFLKLAKILKFPNSFGLSQKRTECNLNRVRLHCVAKKRCPNYKLISGTRFAVDAFDFGPIANVTHYFLTHFHPTHYAGLKKNFKYLIVCSPITARLVRLNLHVSEEYLDIIKVNESRVIEGVIVTALDANHCAGSLMFLFSLPNNENILHVGDFRATSEMESLPCFWNVDIDRLYLDTTYCSPEYDFPNQQESIDLALGVIKTYWKVHPRLLVVFGTYITGKEKAWLRIATEYNWKVWTSSASRRILDCLCDDEISKRMSTDPLLARLHLLPMSRVDMKNLDLYLSKFDGTFTHVLGLRLSGSQKWVGKNLERDRKVVIQGIPYSEHSSFKELERFVKYLNPKKIIPTVQTKRSPDAMASIFNEWSNEAQIA